MWEFFFIIKRKTARVCVLMKYSESVPRHWGRVGINQDGCTTQMILFFKKKLNFPLFKFKC